MPSVFLKGQTADFAGTGQGKLSLEEVLLPVARGGQAARWKTQSCRCSQPATLLLAPSCDHADRETGDFRIVFHPFLLIRRDE